MKRLLSSFLSFLLITSAPWGVSFVNSYEDNVPSSIDQVDGAGGALPMTSAAIKNPEMELMQRTGVIPADRGKAHPGTPPYVRCQKLLNFPLEKHTTNFVKEQNKGRIQHIKNEVNQGMGANSIWGHLMEEAQKDITSAKDNNGRRQKANIWKLRGQVLADSLNYCAAVYFLTSYDSDKETHPEKVYSTDRQIVCRGSGSETQDYNACVSAVTAYDLAVTTLEQALNMTDELQKVHAEQSAQLEAFRQQNQPVNGDSQNTAVDAAAPLRMMRKQIVTRQEIAIKRAAAHTGAAAALGAALSGYPDINDLMSECNAHVNAMTGMRGLVPYTDCVEVLKSGENDCSRGPRGPASNQQGGGERSTPETEHIQQEDGPPAEAIQVEEGRAEVRALGEANVQAVVVPVEEHDGEIKEGTFTSDEVFPEEQAQEPAALEDGPEAVEESPDGASYNSQKSQSSKISLAPLMKYLFFINQAHATDLSLNSGSSCESAAGHLELLANQRTREVIRRAIADQSTKAAAAGAQIAVAKLHLDKIDKLIKHFEGLSDDQQNDPSFANDVLLTECEFNPSLRHCYGVTNAARDVSFAEMNPEFDFQNGSTGGVGATGETSDGRFNAGNDLTPSEVDSNLASEGVGIGGGGEDANKTNSLQPVAGAKIGRGSTMGSAGSGGGGGGSGGGGGLGGGGAPTAGDPRNNAASAGLAAKRRGRLYSGKTKAHYASNLRGKRRGKNKNPFDGLLKGKGKKGDILNFRGIASNLVGSKSGKGLFQMISARYAKVKKQNRLLEYILEK